MDQLSWIYFPTALVLGALHALEPGHAKTLTAAYLIGIKGTKKDALLLGVSVAVTHSFVVVLIATLALYLGKETFTKDVTHWLQVGSAVVVIALGAWLFIKRLLQKKASRKYHHDHHDHSNSILIKGSRHQGQLELVPTWVGEKIKFIFDAPLSIREVKIFIQRANQIEVQTLFSTDGQKFFSQNLVKEPHNFMAELVIEEKGHREVIPFELKEEDLHKHENSSHHHVSPESHDHGHVHEIPDYVRRGERPTFLQIMTFGAVGGMIPCPASITVMLLALSVGQVGLGLFSVLGFSLGLALALVGVGLVVVAGVSRIQTSGRFTWLSENAPLLSAAIVVLSGTLALLIHPSF